MKSLISLRTLNSACIATLLASQVGCLTKETVKVVDGPTVTVPGPSTTTPAPTSVLPGGTKAPNATNTEGPITDGGGNIDKDGNVFDLIEDQGLVEIDIKNEPFYGRELLPKFALWNKVLLRGPVSGDLNPKFVQLYDLGTGNRYQVHTVDIARKLLDEGCRALGFGEDELKRCFRDSTQGIRLGDLLRAQIKTRKWYLEKNQITAQGCVNKSMVALDTKIAACQDDYEVRISRKAWEKMDDKNKAFLVTHELILTLARNMSTYKENKEIAERAVRVINRTMQTSTDLKEIANTLSSRGGNILSIDGGPNFWNPSFGKGVELHEQWIEASVQKACSEPAQGMMKVAQSTLVSVQKLHGLTLVNPDGSIPSGEKVVAYKNKILNEYGMIPGIPQTSSFDPMTGASNDAVFGTAESKAFCELMSTH